MTAALGLGLRLASVATIALAGWLAIVVLFVLPTRDPDHVALWSIVAVGAASLGCLAWAASVGRVRPTAIAGIALFILGIAGLAFGLLVLGSTLSDALTADPEGYLLVVGAILTAEAVLVLAWLAAALPRGRP